MVRWLSGIGNCQIYQPKLGHASFTHRNQGMPVLPTEIRASQFYKPKSGHARNQDTPVWPTEMRACQFYQPKSGQAPYLQAPKFPPATTEQGLRPLESRHEFKAQ